MSQITMRIGAFVLAGFAVGGVTVPAVKSATVWPPVSNDTLGVFDKWEPTAGQIVSALGTSERGRPDDVRHKVFANMFKRRFRDNGDAVGAKFTADQRLKVMCRASMPRPDMVRVVNAARTEAETVFGPGVTVDLYATTAFGNFKIGESGSMPSHEVCFLTEPERELRPRSVPHASKQNLKVGTPAPGLEVVQDGRTTSLPLPGLGQRPVVLIFGSDDCPYFRASAYPVSRLYKDYRDRVTFVQVLNRVAHPKRGDAKRAVAGERVLRLTGKPAVSAATVASEELPTINVDYVADPIYDSYDPLPDRIYVLDKKGRVASVGAQGPYGFSPDTARPLLRRLLAE